MLKESKRGLKDEIGSGNGCGDGIPFFAAQFQNETNASKESTW